MKFNPYADRPKVELPALRWWEQLLFWGALLAFAYMFFELWSVWDTLPPRVATHFGIDGKADGWGPRSMLLMLPSIGLGTCVLMLALSRFPQIGNYPVNVTEFNAERVYVLGRELLLVINGMITGMFVWIQHEILQGAMGGEAKLNVLIIFGITGLLMASSLVYLVRIANVK